MRRLDTTYTDMSQDVKEVVTPEVTTSVLNVTENKNYTVKYDSEGRVISSKPTN